ncbi:fungal-specific transcription factor domain-containing protein, partial [Aspergillus recurvatus]
RHSATGRVHSLGGCKTCRNRHAKCDRNRPACRQCINRRIACEGYPEDIRWMPTWSDQSGIEKGTECGGSDERVGVRHYLYTESARLSMSNALNECLLHGSVDESLHLAILSFASRDQHIVGPFTVLNFSMSICQSGKIENHQASNPIASTHLNTPNGCQPTTSLPDISSYADGLLEWSDLFSLNDDFGNIGSDLLVDPEIGLDLTPRPQMHTQNDIFESPDQNVTLDIPLGTSQLPSADRVGQAGFLLRHFREAVVSQLTVVPPSKTPWDTLNVPSTLGTLGELAVLGSANITHARLANFYSLQACAATHLAMTPLAGFPEHYSKEHWKRVSDQAYSEAKYNMKLSLSSESDGPRRAKSKDQLMALCFLTDAERVLRTRGLTKRNISRKARLLFNVYTWLRIVGESTYVLHDHSSIQSFVEAINLHFQPRECVRRENLAADRSIRLDDFLLFENIENDLNIDELKDRRLDLPDLHLQDSRKSMESLSYQVYGMSETWLSLVSQTTRLANVIDALKVAQDAELPVSYHVLTAVQRRELRLENVVQSFVGRFSPQGEHSSGQKCPHIHIVRALNSALVIPFYRRVRHVHPAMLANHVDSVVAAMDAFYSCLGDGRIPGPGALWPVFVAGCEAINKVQREAIWELIGRGEARSGLAPYQMIKNILSKIWVKQADKRPDNCGQAPLTWMDVMRSRQSWPVFA